VLSGQSGRPLPKQGEQQILKGYCSYLAIEVAQSEGQVVELCATTSLARLARPELDRPGLAYRMNLK
jgi:hypothetical protein